MISFIKSYQIFVELAMHYDSKPNLFTVGIVS